MTPEALECARPFVQGTDRGDIRAIEHLPPVAARVDQPDIAQYLEVLGDGRLPQFERIDDLAYGALVGCQEHEDVAPPRFSDRVERISRRGGPRHESNHIPIREYVNSWPGCARRGAPLRRSRGRRPRRTACR